MRRPPDGFHVRTFTLEKDLMRFFAPNAIRHTFFFENAVPGRLRHEFREAVSGSQSPCRPDMRSQLKMHSPYERHDYLHDHDRDQFPR